MTESEIRQLVEQEIAGFSDARVREVVSTWKLEPEDIGDGWQLYRINEDTAIAYSCNEGWAEAPWGLADGLACGDPSVRTYCPSLQETVLEFLEAPLSTTPAQQTGTREAMMERARQKRLRKKRR